MSAGEIARRARVALRDRIAPPAYAAWPPERAAERLFEGGAARALGASLLPRWVRGLEPAGVPAPAKQPARSGGFVPAGLPEPGDEIAAVLAAARGLLEGRWSLFGHAVRLDD